MCPAYANGNVYDGGWKDGQPHGNGKMTYANGDVYDGDWKDYMPNGHGTMIYKSFLYTGGWKYGDWHGVGKFQKVIDVDEPDSQKRSFESTFGVVTGMSVKTISKVFDSGMIIVKYPTGDKKRVKFSSFKENDSAKKDFEPLNEEDAVLYDKCKRRNAWALPCLAN